MLIKNDRMIMNRILKPLQLKGWIRRAPAAAFLGCCILLFGAPLYAQDPPLNEYIYGPPIYARDLLLKEYIYLDGKLLAVERQVLTQAAQQPAGDSSKDTKFAQYSSSSIHGMTPPGSTCKPGISVIPDMQEMYASHGPILARVLYPDRGQCRFAGSEDFKLRHSAYRRQWKVAGISEHKNGGSNDGL